MPIYVRDASTWRHLNEIVTTDGATPRRVTEFHVNDSGTWRRVHRGNPLILVERPSADTNRATVTTTNVQLNNKPTGHAWTIAVDFNKPIIQNDAGISTFFRLTIRSFVGDVRPTGFTVNDVVSLILRNAANTGNIFSVGPHTPSYTKGFSETFLAGPNVTEVTWSWFVAGAGPANDALAALTADGTANRILEIQWANVTP